MWAGAARPGRGLAWASCPGEDEQSHMRRAHVSVAPPRRGTIGFGPSRESVPLPDSATSRSTIVASSSAARNPGTGHRSCSRPGGRGEHRPPRRGSGAARFRNMGGGNERTLGSVRSRRRPREAVRCRRIRRVLSGPRDPQAEVYAADELSRVKGGSEEPGLFNSKRLASRFERSRPSKSPSNSSAGLPAPPGMATAITCARS